MDTNDRVQVTLAATHLTLYAAGERDFHAADLRGARGAGAADRGAARSPDEPWGTVSPFFGRPEGKSLESAHLTGHSFAIRE